LIAKEAAWINYDKIKGKISRRNNLVGLRIDIHVANKITDAKKVPASIMIAGTSCAALLYLPYFQYLLLKLKRFGQFYYY